MTSWPAARRKLQIALGPTCLSENSETASYSNAGDGDSLPGKRLRKQTPRGDLLGLAHANVRVCACVEKDALRTKATRKTRIVYSTKELRSAQKKACVQQTVLVLESFQPRGFGHCGECCVKEPRDRARVAFSSESIVT